MATERSVQSCVFHYSTYVGLITLFILKIFAHIYVHIGMRHIVFKYIYYIQGNQRKGNVFNMFQLRFQLICLCVHAYLHMCVFIQATVPCRYMRTTYRGKHFSSTHLSLGIKLRSPSSAANASSSDLSPWLKSYDLDDQSLVLKTLTQSDNQ